MACLAFINLIFIDPSIVDDSAEIPTRCSVVIEFIIPKLNFVIINSITKLHLVGISTESSTMHGSMHMNFINAKQAIDVHAYK